MIPIRCFTCNKCIAHMWITYNIKIESGCTPNDVLNELGLKRYCCRRMFLGYVEITDKLILYTNNQM